MTATSETPPPVVPGEVRSLTGLRIVAALWVVLFHFSFTPGLTDTRGWGRLAFVVRNGALGVDLFYVLSGFVITLTYVDKLGRRAGVRSSIAFWWARASRVWPVYALVTSLYGIWLGWKSTRVTDGFLVWQTRQPRVDVQHWLEQLSMLQLWHRPYFDGSSWDGPAWSISAEWAAYTAFPLVVLLLWRLRRAPVPVTAVLAVACMVPFAWLCYRTGNPAFPFSWAERIAGGFLSGAFTCLTVRRLPPSRRLDRVAGAVAVLSVLSMVVLLWWGWRRGGGEGEYAGVLVLFFPVLVGSLALSTRGLSAVLGSRPLVHGGRISYSLYLVHVPLFEILWTVMGWEPRVAAGSTAAAVLVPVLPLVALLAAHLLYRGVEEPARLWLRDRALGRWARSGPTRRILHAGNTVQRLDGGAPSQTPAPAPSSVVDGVGGGDRRSHVVPQTRGA